MDYFRWGCWGVGEGVKVGSLMFLILLIFHGDDFSFPSF